MFRLDPSSLVETSNSEVIGKKPARKNDNDGEFPLPKKPRSSPLTVNPSNSGVIGGGYVNKKKGDDDDVVEEIDKLNKTTFWRIKEQERHNKVVEKKLHEECAMYKATALKENEERSLLQIQKNKELFNQFKDLVKSGLSKDDIEALFPGTFPTIYFTKYDTFLN